MKTLIKKEFEIIEQGDAEGQLSSNQFKLLRDFVFESEKRLLIFSNLYPKMVKKPSEFKIMLELLNYQMVFV